MKKLDQFYFLTQIDSLIDSSEIIKTKCRALEKLLALNTDVELFLLDLSKNEELPEEITKRAKELWEDI